MIGIIESQIKTKMDQLSANSWIEVKDDFVFDEQDFQDLLKDCPTVRNKVRMGARLLDIARFERLYGSKNYRYSGVERQAEPVIPKLVQQCLDYANAKYARTGGFHFDGALTNWYMDGTHSIGMRSRVFSLLEMPRLIQESQTYHSLEV